MSKVRKNEPLAAAVAVILAGAASAPASGQTRLDVYSDDFTGGSMAPPASAVRPTTVDMNVPRLHAIRDGIAALRAELGSHTHPAHTHPPHVHIDNNVIVGGISSDGNDDPSVTGYAANGSTLSLSPQDLASGQTVVGGTTYYSSQQKANQAAGGDGDGDGGY